jgi:gamma-glutamyl hercynylcysteine S-oxide synthase
MLGAEPDSAAFVFDNEKWAHPHTVQPFQIARAPVTNSDFALFVEAGGYSNRALWSSDGWDWLQTSGVRRPAYWEGEPGAWRLRWFDRIIDLPPHHPVMFVNWHEANAYCVFANRRLPSELEWEAAATGEHDPARGTLAATKRGWPWGNAVDTAATAAHANLDGSAHGLVGVAACAAGDSAFGCRQMMGNVWEWTASDFLPYPGFTADAYAEYSEPWFGTRKVLRGGCWATRSRLVTPRYRNFFTPERRDIFAGFRTCAL